METVLVQITNNKAYKLLEDLEDLDIIKVTVITELVLHSNNISGITSTINQLTD